MSPIYLLMTIAAPSAPSNRSHATGPGSYWQHWSSVQIVFKYKDSCPQMFSYVGLLVRPTSQFVLFRRKRVTFFSNDSPNFIDRISFFFLSANLLSWSAVVPWKKNQTDLGWLHTILYTSQMLIGSRFPPTCCDKVPRLFETTFPWLPLIEQQIFAFKWSNLIRDGSGLKRNWLQNTASVNIVGGGGTLRPATGPINGLWGKD